MAEVARGPTNPEWETTADRFAWLAREKFSSLSALARALGFSHTIVAEVAKGRAPGPRLLDAVSTRLGVDRGWLTTGRGRPFPDDAAGAFSIPVSYLPLPGLPAAHQFLVHDRILVPGVAASGTVYWLALKSSQPLTRRPGSGFRVGDRLLMEADPARFPGEADLLDDLCVVRGDAGEGGPRLATVRYHSAGMDTGPARLGAEYPAPLPGAGPEAVERVYRHRPDGEVEYSERRVPGTRPGRPDPAPGDIRYTDIAAVWLKILYRPFG